MVFESEEKARAREQDPACEAALEGVRATMAEVFEGPPEFVDLEVLEDTVDQGSAGGEPVAPDGHAARVVRSPPGPSAPRARGARGDRLGGAP